MAETESAHLVGGRYELRRRLGAGGMSEVWLAFDRRLSRPVAVKLLSPALAADERFVERFRREAQALAMLRHRNVVQVHDCGEHDGTEYLVMEYVPGSDLKAFLRARGRLDEDAALRLVEQAAEGLQAAHDQGIVHRDVKPHNLLLEEDGTLRVTDFGIACSVAAEQAEPTGLIGTAHYLSPEQVRGQSAEYRSDVYALGVVLYELLCGQPPFDGETPVAVALKHRDEPPPSPRALCPELSPEVEAVLRRALEKEPSHRYQSAAQLREALVAARLARARPAGERLIDVESTTRLPNLRDATARLPRLDPAAAVRPGRPARPVRPALAWSGGALALVLLVVGAQQWTPPWSGRAVGAPETVAGAAAARPTGASSARSTPAPSPATTGLAALVRAAGQRTSPCEFVLGFKRLRDQIPSVVGDCVENEWHDDATGNTYQRTSRGLLVWQKSNGVSQFSDGQRVWLDGPHGLQVRRTDERLDWERR